MEKTLVYHIYLCDDIDTNVAYKINAECLKYYIEKFDKVKYVLVMDNLEDIDLRNKGIKYVSDLQYKGETNIIFRENTEIGEAATLRDYVVNNKDDVNYTFFCHTKGITQFSGKNPGNKNSIFNWILIMYFYNLNYIKKMEDYFFGKINGVRNFFGTLLMSKNDDDIPLSIPNYHYSGSFYWVNKPSLFKLGDYNYIFSNRYDAEFYPGYTSGKKYNFSMASYNDVMLILNKKNLGCFYALSDEAYDYIIGLLGDKEKFYEFKNYIKEKLNGVIDF